MYTAPNGKTYDNVGAALRDARWGEFGASRTVTLKRDGYSSTVIAKGGPAGWYVKDLGRRLPASKPKKKKLTIKYRCVMGRCVKGG